MNNTKKPKEAVIAGVVAAILGWMLLIVLITIKNLQEGNCCQGFLGTDISVWESIQLTAAMTTLNPGNLLAGVATFLTIKNFLNSSMTRPILIMAKVAVLSLLYVVLVFIFFNINLPVDLESWVFGLLLPMGSVPIVLWLWFIGRLTIASIH